MNLHIHDYIDVSKSNIHDSYWPGCPFNIKFRSKKLNSSQRLQITGPCIYLILVNNEVIYIGKYQPKHGNVVSDRWIKHLTTISARGHRLGFRSSSGYQKIRNHIENNSLKKILEKARSIKDGERFFKDSGHTTSINRIRYASDNWEQFKNLTKEDFLDSFSFHAFILKSNKKQNNINHDISQIEKGFLEKIQPPCNKEFNIVNQLFHRPIRIRLAKTELWKNIQEHSNILNWDYLVLH